MTTVVAPRTPLETLALRTEPEDIRTFLVGCSSIRRSLESQDGARLGLALRGSMPMFWAANGLTEVEDPVIAEDMAIEIPVGTYHFIREDGSPGVRSPSKRAKREIIDRAFSEAGLEAGESLTLLDEIQSGGTVTQLVRGSLHYARNHGLKLPLQLIAAEDTRTASTRKTGSYRRISTNQTEGIAATIVRIPLVGCDRDNLLDRVDFVGEHHLADDAPNLFSVRRNTEAELMFRTLGSLTRSVELGRDDDFLRKIFDPRLKDNVELARKFEGWLASILAPETAQQR